MARSISKNRLIRTLFTQLAPAYDVLDDPLTWKHGTVWRQKAFAAAKIPTPRRVLDACAGTGLLTLNLQPHMASMHALDSSAGMLEKLSQKLAASGLMETDVKVYFVELTAIVRRYIERTTGIRAPEQTTEEFLCEIRRVQFRL